MCVLQVASSSASSGAEFVGRFGTPPPPPPPEEPDHRSRCIPPPPPYLEVFLGVRCVLASPVCLQVRSDSPSASTSGATLPVSLPAPVPQALVFCGDADFVCGSFARLLRLWLFVVKNGPLVYLLLLRITGS